MYVHDQSHVMKISLRCLEDIAEAAVQHLCLNSCHLQKSTKFSNIKLLIVLLHRDQRSQKLLTRIVNRYFQLFKHATTAT